MAIEKLTNRGNWPANNNSHMLQNSTVVCPPTSQLYKQYAPYALSSLEGWVGDDCVVGEKGWTLDSHGFSLRCRDNKKGQLTNRKEDLIQA